jgi:hypothetical protein
MAVEARATKKFFELKARKTQGGLGMNAPNANSANLADLIKELAKAGGVPITLSEVPPPRVPTGGRLADKERVTVAFPPCSDELLALIKTTGIEAKDDVTKYFDEYFKFQKHITLGQSPSKEDFATSDRAFPDPALLDCLDSTNRSTNIMWPTQCCLCSPCVTLGGNRNLPPDITKTIGRLFIGDLLWLFYFERLGIFQILGAILDAFAYNGRLPISNGSLDPAINDDIVALVLEVMVRQTKMGMSSTVRDRTCAYRTSLGWTSEVGRKLGVDTMVSTGFNTLFHKFIFNAIEFYKDKRLAVAIRGTAAPVAPPSVATLITISDTIDILKKRFEAFSYGRNYYNTLSGIVWAIAGMSVIRELRTTLGIPPAFGNAHEYIPAAYDVLVMKRPVTQGDTNRYLLHRECARNGRDILLDLEVIDHMQRLPTGELDNWLYQIEAKVEAYRTAYRTLTGVDLGTSSSATIEQQA